MEDVQILNAHFVDEVHFTQVDVDNTSDWRTLEVSQVYSDSDEEAPVSKKIYFNYNKEVGTLEVNGVKLSGSVLNLVRQFINQ